MKNFKRILIAALCLVIGVGAFAFSACNGGKEILVVSREAGSGTREAFDRFVTNPDDAAENLERKDSADKATARDAVTKDAVIQNNTNAVITKVKSSKNGIGYVSYGAVRNDAAALGVKVLNLEDTVCGTPTGQAGAYALQRPFNVLAKEDGLSFAAKDFYDFLRSPQAQAVVKNEYMDITAAGAAYAGKTAAALPSAADSVIVAGSSSVDPLMKDLIAEYRRLNPHIQANHIKMDTVDSTYGRNQVGADTSGKLIGTASSGNPNGEGYQGFKLCDDHIAIIVNQKNTLSNITKAQLWKIYTGAVMTFDELAA